jgi:hypothetical protein
MFSVSVCSNVSMYVSTYVRMYVSAGHHTFRAAMCTYVRMYVCMCGPPHAHVSRCRMYVRTYVRMYTSAGHHALMFCAATCKYVCMYASVSNCISTHRCELEACAFDTHTHTHTTQHNTNQAHLSAFNIHTHTHIRNTTQHQPSTCPRAPAALRRVSPR